MVWAMDWSVMGDASGSAVAEAAALGGELSENSEVRAEGLYRRCGELCKAEMEEKAWEEPSSLESAFALSGMENSSPLMAARDGVGAGLDCRTGDAEEKTESPRVGAAWVQEEERTGEVEMSRLPRAEASLPLVGSTLREMMEAAASMGLALPEFLMAARRLTFCAMGAKSGLERGMLLSVCGESAPWLAGLLLCRRRECVGGEAAAPARERYCGGWLEWACEPGVAEKEERLSVEEAEEGRAVMVVERLRLPELL
jgi:hypothetical protein